MRKRSRLEIFIDVLRAIKRGTIKPTRIMYRTNLSWKPLMKVLEAMIAQGLIEAKNDGKHITYGITKKGREIVEYFDQGMKMIEVG